MTDAIPRSAYPDTRDEQAMKRFMAGTLNVGHHLTFQRKGQIVNASPQGTERELLNRYFEQSAIHKNDRCVNVKLHLHAKPIDPDGRLSRDPEYNVYPYIHAQVSLTPAESTSTKGTKRNMHMQTHNPLPNAPTFWVFGLGHRKGELALLRFVKDTITFKIDLERDEVEDAARQGRSFVTPWPADTAEQMLNLPQHASMNIRELFEAGSEMASTQSDVASQARRAAAMAQHQHAQLFPRQHQQQQHIAPGSVLLDGQQSVQHAQLPTNANWQYYPALLTSKFHPAPGENASPSPADPQAVAPQSAREGQAQLTPDQAGPTLSPLEATVQAGIQAAKIIFPLRAAEQREGSDQPASPTLPDARYFLDLERCRLVLRDVNVPAHELFSSWQVHQSDARQTVECEGNDSGVALREAQPRSSEDQASQSSRATSAHVGGSAQRHGDSTNEAQSYADFQLDQSAWQMISPERPKRGMPRSRSSSNAARQAASRARKGKARSESDKFDDTSSAATALLALSPKKPVDGQSV